MPPWPTVAILAGFLAGLGAAFDLWLLKRHKGAIHEALLKGWVVIDDTTIPHLYRPIVSLTLSLAKRVKGKRWLSLRTATLVAVASTVLTTTAMVIGGAIGSGGIFSTIARLDESLLNFISIDPARLAEYYVVNLLCDVATVAATLGILYLILTSRWWLAVPLFALDIAIAVFLTGVCIWAAKAIGHQNAAFLCVEELWHAIQLVFRRMVSGGFHTDVAGIAWDIRLYAYTTLIPTLFYLALLVTAMIAKPLVEVGKSVTAYLFFHEAEKEDATKVIVFTLVGSVFGMLALLAKTIDHFF